MNILITCIYFILTIPWSLAYGCGQQRYRRDKKSGQLTTISMAMVIQRYDMGRIARWSTSRASLEATACCHWASACAVLPLWLLMVMAIQRYDVGCIARWSTSRASLEAAGCCHRVSAWAVSPRQLPCSTNLNKKHKTLT
jgi:hypothetical protein